MSDEQEYEFASSSLFDSGDLTAAPANEVKPSAADISLTDTDNGGAKEAIIVGNLGDQTSAASFDEHPSADDTGNGAIQPAAGLAGEDLERSGGVEGNGNQSTVEMVDSSKVQSANDLPEPSVATPTKSLAESFLRNGTRLGDRGGTPKKDQRNLMKKNKRRK
jgi:hypothetical protein